MQMFLLEFITGWHMSSVVKMGAPIAISTKRHIKHATPYTRYPLALATVSIEQKITKKNYMLSH